MLAVNISCKYVGAGTAASSPILNNCNVEQCQTYANLACGITGYCQCKNTALYSYNSPSYYYDVNYQACCELNKLIPYILLSMVKSGAMWTIILLYQTSSRFKKI